MFHFSFSGFFLMAPRVKTKCGGKSAGVRLKVRFIKRSELYGLLMAEIDIT